MIRRLFFKLELLFAVLSLSGNMPVLIIRVSGFINSFFMFLCPSTPQLVLLGKRSINSDIVFSLI